MTTNQSLVLMGIITLGLAALTGQLLIALIGIFMIVLAAI